MASRMREARIKLTVIRDNSTRNALRGVTADMQRESARAQKTQEKAAKQAVKLQEKTEAAKRRESAKTEAEERRATARRVKDAERAAAREIAIHERTMRQRQRIAIQWMRAESRERDQVWKAEQRKTSARTTSSGNAIVGGAIGVSAGALATLTAAITKLSDFASGSRDKIGAVRAEDAVLETKATQEEFVRSMTQAGQTQEQMKATLNVLLAASKEFGVMPQAMLAAINQAQDSFSDPSFVTNNAAALAKMSRGTNASVSDITRAGLTAKTKYGLDDAQTLAYLNSLASQTGEGSASFANIASDFAAAAAGLANAFGDKGKNLETAVIGGAIAQTMARSLKDKGESKEESATVMNNWVDSLTNTGTQKKLRKHGIDIADKKTGALKSAPEVMAELFAPENMAKLTPAVLNEIFPEKRARLGMSTLLEEGRAHPDRFARLSDSDPAAGAEMITKMVENLRALPTERINQMQVEAQSVALTSDKEINVITNAAAADIESERIAKDRLGTLLPMLGLNGGITAASIGAYDALRGDNSTMTGLLNSAGGNVTDKDVSRFADPARALVSGGLLGPLNAMAMVIGNAVKDAMTDSKSSLAITVEGAGVTDVRQTGVAAPIDVMSNGRRGR